jgi:uncharacterized protein
MSKHGDNSVFYSSVVLEHIVSKADYAAFSRWYKAMTQIAEQQPGFLRVDHCPPLECVDDAIKQYAIVHFDTIDHLNDWLTSKQRTEMLESGQNIFRDYKYKSFTTGLEGWFSQQAGERTGLGPDRWKQVLSVVLGLYPLVMAQSLLSALGLMASWPPAAAMLVNNLITSSALTYTVMPQISKLFSFWLYPAYQDRSRRSNLLGTAILLAAFVVMVLFFHQVQQRMMPG